MKLGLLTVLFALSAGALCGAESVKATKPAPKTQNNLTSLTDCFKPPSNGWPENPAKGTSGLIPVDGLTEKILAPLNNPALIGKALSTDLPVERGLITAVPDDYSRDRAYPLVIVLHGGPGRPESMLNMAPSLVKHGAIVVFPASLRDVLLEWNYPHSGMYLLRVIQQVAKSYHLDPKRLYLTGFSMGGGGTWYEGAVLHDLWAAICPMAGWYRPDDGRDNTLLKSVPVYCIHGDQDHNVPIDCARAAFAELAKLGNKDCFLLERPGVAHDFPTPEQFETMWDWMFKHQRASPANMKAAVTTLADSAKGEWTPVGDLLGTYNVK
jgi:dienelactone hydrolase